MMSVSRYLCAALVALLAGAAGCAEGTHPVEPIITPNPTLSIEGDLLNGGGGGIAARTVTLTVFPVGCAGQPLLGHETLTSASGHYSGSFPNPVLPALVCVRAESDVRPDVAWDNVVFEKDSIDAHGVAAAMLPLRYDWSGAEVYSSRFAPASVSLLDVAVRVATSGAADQMLKGAQRLNVFKLDAGSTVTVTANFQGSGYVAEVSKSLASRPDWRNTFNVIISAHDPLLTCFGCFGKVSAPIRTATGQETGDSLFVVWGGTPISDVVVY